MQVVDRVAALVASLMYQAGIREPVEWVILATVIAVFWMFLVRPAR